jgi:hypothetical protein
MKLQINWKVLSNDLNRIQFQVNRNADQDATLESISDLKEHIEKIQEMISLEQDDFAQQFRG